ncbi:HlyD family efflux transporter periplasmic adaptor subunit [Janthinobacterium sp. FT14W]|uniref:efflux RND transporter periplasmic adaptor subunit n=1 Tax=Janthinobacterium sp. FT14W TaxID=2654253 RepID=UPI001264CB75|nr:efflux RND transporter periplasmic adaptor subunit [Janthinobacterium sp. FT14W]KAB8061272.1 HlyD family efflux transporter periplasmic adaptor subunit [Janthinobacterium sp. FT14W]
MDRVKPQSGNRTRSRIAWIAVVALVVTGLGASVAFIDFSTARVDSTKIAISTVEQGTLEIKVRGSGQLLPKNVEYIGAQINGRVIKKYVQPGDVTKVGQVLLELTNPQLVAKAEEAYSAWQGAVTELRATESDLKTNLLNQEIALTQARFGLQSAQLQLEAETELKAANLVPEVDFKRTQLNVKQLKQALDIGQDRVNALRANIQMKVAVNQARVTELARALERAKNDVSNLKVVAGIDGIVQVFKVDIGQELASGQSIGNIAQPNSLYAELKVPARDAAEVQIGQNVAVDTHNGIVNGAVSRVDPAITNGIVVVDVALKDALPTGARPQLAVDGDIYLVRLPNALYVRKPPYAQPNSPVSIYKLDDSANYADKVVIKSGKLSLTLMQVLQGLKAGDRIITSEAGDWQNKERIRIK